MQVADIIVFAMRYLECIYRLRFRFWSSQSVTLSITCDILVCSYIQKCYSGTHICILHELRGSKYHLFNPIAMNSSPSWLTSKVRLPQHQGCMHLIRFTSRAIDLSPLIGPYYASVNYSLHFLVHNNLLGFWDFKVIQNELQSVINVNRNE